MDIETYQQSIAQMNSSLHEIQSDLQRLASQQNQLQNPVANSSQNAVQQLQSFATLQNNFVNSRQTVNYGGPPQIHSLLYNNPGWHSLVSQSPPPPAPQQQTFTHHNNFVNQQQQMHSLMNQQPQMNHYNTIPQPAMRQFSNYSPQPQQHYQDSSSMYQQSAISQQQQQQVNQLLRGAQQQQQDGGEFYLHNPPPPPPTQKRTWGNHWGNSN
ncbi:hypothetical protein J6590_063363, partial [Homalodisca vitripennis]